jgi:hypothetical protein
MSLAALVVLIHQHLSQLPGPKLLVFDDPKREQDLLSSIGAIPASPSLHVLITSRSPNWDHATVCYRNASTFLWELGLKK